MNDKQSEDFEMEAAIIFGIHKPIALQRALSHAGEDGFVASMPQLIHARTNAPVVRTGVIHLLESRR